MDDAQSAKRAGELAYWITRQAEEGRLRNTWYENFYTAPFALTREGYAGKRLLDIGCGPRGSLEWASMADTRVGLDPLAADYTRFEIAEHAMTYVTAGAEAMPFPDRSFDVVSAFNSLDHVDDPSRVIEEIKRVTRIGGLFLLLVDIHRRPTPQEPTVLPWYTERMFQPEFQPQIVCHLEKQAGGLYQSVRAGTPFDHSDAEDRYGILLARMVRVAPESSLSSQPASWNSSAGRTREKDWRQIVKRLLGAEL